MPKKNKVKGKGKNKGKKKDPKPKHQTHTIPDSTVGPKVYSENITDFLDDSNLDPANDPTLQPVVDAFQRESQEDYWNSVRNLRDAANSKNLLGGDYYRTAMGRANEEHMESVDQTLANLYNAVRENALNRKLGALDQINARDIAAGQQETSLKAARISAGPGHASVNLQRKMWQAQRPWDDMRNLIDTMRGLGDLSGVYEYPGYVPDAMGYNGPNAAIAGLMGGIGGWMNAQGAMNQGAL